MNTIHWLAVFGTIVGFGVFMLSILGVWFMTMYGTIQERMMVEVFGWLPAFRWRWLLVGCICLIVGVTL